MEKTVLECLSALQLGEMQVFEQMAVIPLVSELSEGPEYITLPQAMSSGVLVITEVSNGGSVPELGVKNSGDLPVLILDGEELVGAKQNRVVNATILLPEKAETTIPVSCTESGRWSYASPVFADSGVVLPKRIRSNKVASVSASLVRDRTFTSDQSRVWADIDELSDAQGVVSPTSAMKDVFQKKSYHLEDYVKAFKPVSGQRGLLAFIGGRIAGFDYVSRPGAYSFLHDKLVKSYAIDSLSGKSRTCETPTLEMAVDFFKRILDSHEATYPSIGYGHDHRYSIAGTVGSALVHQECVVHTAFFTVETEENSERMSSHRRRADYRRVC
jgi:hypothetical protein